MSHAKLQATIDAAWEQRDGINASSKGEVRDAVETVLAMLDSGKLRVAEKAAGTAPAEGWVVHQWVKKAVLLSFRLKDNAIISFAGGNTAKNYGWDKVPLKYASWSATDFQRAGFRAVPGAVVRQSAFIARNVVLMPSFVNVGAFVDSGTMVDTCRAASASAVCSSRCRPIPRSSRTTASSAPAPRSWKASSSAKAR
jgi:2,3,4,5-tetrahydropyridine-2-carboxylate N-succinyltransferase